MICFLFSLATANEVTVPTVGAYVSIVDCTTKISAHPWSSDKTGQLVIDQARAQEICQRAQGNLVIAEAEAKAIANRSIAELALLFAAAHSLEKGGSISYTNDGKTFSLTAGDAANWREYMAAVTSIDPRLLAGYPGGGYIGGGDPNLYRPDLYRLAGGQTGIYTPAMPGTSSTSATAACGTAAECQARLTALMAVNNSQ